jgi:diguanylate cyclase (GGDEF)-like protein
LACGINFLVQLTGGLRSPWQALYIIISGLAVLSFPARLVIPALGLVLALETSNWLIHPTGSASDLLRLAGLMAASALAFHFMEKAERRRAERAEEELHRLNMGLQQLTDSGDGGETSILSEEGKRVSRVEYVKELERRLGELLKLVWAATGAHSAFLIQENPDGESFSLRLVVDETGSSSPEPVNINSGLLAEVLRENRELSVSEPDRPLPDFPWYVNPPVLHSLLVIPMGKLAGPRWVCVLNHTEPDHFDSHRRELARSFVDQMTEWLTSTRQLADLDLLSGEFRRLYEASAALSHALRVDQILQHILNFCKEVSRFETCAICLVGEGEESFTVNVAEGYPDRIKGSLHRLDSSTWTGWILRARDEPLIIRIPRRSGMPLLDAREKLATGVSFLGVPMRAKNRVSGVVLMTRRGNAFSSNDARVLRILCNQAAVAIENARVYEQLERLAATDALTGLFNRRYFERALEREASRLDRHKGSIALLLLDIDHFKQLNDTYGHPMGDVVLKRVAETLTRELRKGDVLARFGGEEFVILLPEGSKRGAGEFAERIREAIASAPIHPGGPRRKVTVSVGWAQCPEDAPGVAELVEMADRALYFAKDTGRNRTAGYHLLRSETKR